MRQPRHRTGELFATIQLGTFVTEPTALRLLSYPEGVFSDPDPGCRVEVWASGKRRVFRRQHGADAVDILAADRFNEAALSYGKQLWKGRQAEVKLGKRIVVSPRHALWLPPFSNDSSSLVESQARASHQSLHGFVSWNDLRDYPTVVQIELRFAKDWDYWEEDEVFSSLVELVWQGVDDDVADLCSFGAVSFEPTGSSVTDSLARWPGAISFLGRRFDRLHPILLGEEALCLRLREALAPLLGQEVEIRRRGSLAMLVLGREVEEALADHEEVKRCLVPREGNPGQTRAPDEALGEYDLGGEDIYVEKTRFIELYGSEALASQDTGAVYWETIDSRICEKAGVVPAAVLVAYSVAEAVTVARQKLRRRYEELCPDLPPAERVWQAHEDVFLEMGERLFGSEKSEVIELIHRHFHAFSLR